MTTVQYGGAPSINLRRQFCQLPPGAHIPNYGGFVPQVRFKEGKSFSQLSHEVAKELPFYDGPTKPVYPIAAMVPKAKVKGPIFSDEIPHLKVPKCNGSNKYFDDMIPGYSSFVMHSRGIEGLRFREMSLKAIDSFINEQQYKAEKEKAFLKTQLFPKLRPIADGESCRDHMCSWVNTRPIPERPDEPLRGEAVMAGYEGHIPFSDIHTTLGKTYSQASRISREFFNATRAPPMRTLNEPYHSKLAQKEYLTKPNHMLNRIYLREGIKPGYSGQVPLLRTLNGHCYTDATRKLPCCSHDLESYGAYLASKTSPS